MINKIELRIGNYVKIRGLYIVQVRGIFTDWFCYNETNACNYEHAEPIPLDATILEKMGFEKLSSVWYIKGDFTIMYGWTEKDGHFFHYTTVDKLVLSVAYKYVHELQNLYKAINNEELNYTP